MTQHSQETTMFTSIPRTSIPRTSTSQTSTARAPDARTALAALAACVAIAVPTLAWAQDAPTTTQPTSIGLVRAVQAAEQALPGHAMEADLDFERGRQLYEVELTSGGKLHEVLVDAFTGKVVSTRSRRVESLWSGWGDRLATIEHSPPLAQTLVAVEKQTGGRAQEVSLESEDGGLYYEIELGSRTGEREVYVDVASGKIVADMPDD